MKAHELYNADLSSEHDIEVSLPGVANKVTITPSRDSRDLAIMEGDIVIGTMQEVAEHEEPDINTDDLILAGITTPSFRWTVKEIPYHIDNDIPLIQRARIVNAMLHISERVNLTFKLRTNEVDYIHFIPSDGCWSYIGNRGGRQEIGLAGGCGFGSIVHEICHALGMWHEQSRWDRDSFIRIIWNNIISGRESQFRNRITGSEDFGNYDPDSIMHYSRFAFSKNGQPTIAWIADPNRPLGQRAGLTALDIATLKHLYPDDIVPPPPPPPENRMCKAMRKLFGHSWFIRRFCE